METVTIEIKSSKAMRLLKDLERLDIIKIHQSAEKPLTKNKASKYRGSISVEDADQLMSHVQEIRNEWDERFPTI